MNRTLSLLVLLSLLLTFRVISAHEPAAKPNVLLICVDDLRPELGCFGVDYIQSPNIDRLASQGTRFTRHYVQAPTCGASRYALLTGTYGGASNGALFQRAKRIAENKTVPDSLPAWFRKHGYTTVSVGKVSHHPGGRGGPNWNDDDQPEMPNSWDRHLLPAGPWQHPRGWMHGLAHGEIRKQASNMDVFQAEPGEDSIYPDGISTKEALRQLDQLAADAEKPFFLAFGILRPHLPFGAPANYLQHYKAIKLPDIPHPGKPSHRTTWHRSGEFMKYNRWGKDPNSDDDFAEEVRRHYAACVSFADAQVGRILERLETHQLTSNTIIVLWGDHGWHLGEHAVWGKHTLFEESLRSPLIICSTETASDTPESDAIVESIDVFPTLCELAGLPTPEFLVGESLAGIMQGREPSDETAVSYFGQARTLRTASHRLIAHRDGYLELYDHRSPDAETVNLAEQEGKFAEEMLRRLNEKMN